MTWLLTAQVSSRENAFDGWPRSTRAAVPGAALIRVSDGSDLDRKNRRHLDAREACQAVSGAVLPPSCTPTTTDALELPSCIRGAGSCKCPR